MKKIVFVIYFVAIIDCINIKYIYNLYIMYSVYNILLVCRMETTQKYIVVQSIDDEYNINAIPQIWLLNNTDISIGNICDWYYPTEIPIKKSEFYAPIEDNWVRKSGHSLHISGN